MDAFGRRRAVFLTSQSDERLVALARAGHEPAFTAIVERYSPELYALARRLSSDGNGEDVLQQAFLGAFAALRAGAEVRHLRGWLYRIVRNAAARSWTPVYMPLDGATASTEDVEDIVEQRALALDALTELSRLPSRQRQAIVGTTLDGRARAEVATSMGLSEGAVRQLVHRARSRLRGVVTAVTPWPLARWLASAPSGGGSPVEVVAGAGAGAASTGGFVGLKLGVVLASGAIATGVAAVDIHGSHRGESGRPIVGAATHTGHANGHAARRGAHPVELARSPAAAVTYGAGVRASRTTSRVMRRSDAGRRPETAVGRLEVAVGHRGAAGGHTGMAGGRPEGAVGGSRAGVDGSGATGGGGQRTAEQPARYDGGGTDAHVTDAAWAQPDGGWYSGGSGQPDGGGGVGGTSGGSGGSSGGSAGGSSGVSAGSDGGWSGSSSPACCAAVAGR